MQTKEREELLSQSESILDRVDITDDFMFSYVMQDPEICIGLLECLLPGRKINRVRYFPIEGDNPSAPQTQKALSASFGKRSVRLDAYLDDGQTIYNIEMQTADRPALPQRARLYQAHIDIHQLNRGMNFDQLRPSFVIFICTFDPFGLGQYRYSFRNVCEEQPGLELDDGAWKLFFNTRGVSGDATPRLKELLKYMNSASDFPVGGTDSDLIHRIDSAVYAAKQSDEWRRAYMTDRIRLRDAELKGRREGLQEGEQRGLQRGEQLGLQRGLQRGEQLGLQRGEQRGVEKTIRQMIASMHSRQYSDEAIADICNISMKELYRLMQPAE